MDKAVLESRKRVLKQASVHQKNIIDTNSRTFQTSVCMKAAHTERKNKPPALGDKIGS
jgi:hypothetical protein